MAVPLAVVGEVVAHVENAIDDGDGLQGDEELLRGLEPESQSLKGVLENEGDQEEHLHRNENDLELFAHVTVPEGQAQQVDEEG